MIRKMSQENLMKEKTRYCFFYKCTKVIEKQKNKSEIL